MLNPADLLCLRELSLFQAARADTFALLARNATTATCPRGAQLVVEGQTDDHLHVLLDGVVELGSCWSDRDTTLALLRPPAVFALASVVLGVPALTSARTLTRSRLLRIPGSDLRQAMRSDIGLCVAITEEVSGCYCGVVRTLKAYKLRGAIERLANYLLSQHRQRGDGPTLRLPCAKRTLASLLGMTPENLSRAFASLAEYGVKVDGPNITLSRPEALIDLAKPNSLIDNHSVSSPRLGQAERERRRGGRNLAS